jgi:carboxyl-terminal processing protease
MVQPPNTGRIALATGLVCLLVGLVGGIIWGGHPTALPGFLRDTLVEKDVATRAALIRNIEDRFYKSVPSDGLREASYKGIVDSLHDRYSQYFTPSEAKQFSQSLNGQFEGVGMSVDSQDTKNGLHVARVFDGSPAKEAGIKPGDLIVAVNGKSILGQSADVTTAKIRGPAGTKVTLSVRRGGTAKPRQVPLERRAVHLPLVEAKMKKSGGHKIGLLRLAEFDKGAHGQVRDALDKLLKQGAQGIVLDLRSNPGGALDEGVLVASEFLPKGKLVVSTRGRTEPEHKFYAVGDQIDPKVPVAVLVDKNSASASEIVTGALRDNGRATVIGQKTFGKGVFQEIESLPNDGLVKLTVGSYYLPHGENLAGNGINPAVKAPVDNVKTPRDESLPVTLRVLAAKLGG